jgi:hypothetical protein
MQQAASAETVPDGVAEAQKFIQTTEANDGLESGRSLGMGQFEWLDAAAQFQPALEFI